MCNWFCESFQLGSCYLSRPCPLTSLDVGQDTLLISFLQVGGSDFAKQQEQLGTPSLNVFFFLFFCVYVYVLTAYRLGEALPRHSFIQWIGEEKYQKLAKFILKYIANLDIPVMRGTFIEFRNGMINVSPVGRNASTPERNDYQAFDLKHGIREKFVEALKEEFPDYGLT